MGETTPSAPLADLNDRIDTSRYLRGTSDIVSLMVLEHQCLVHNLLTRVSMDYRHAKWRASTIGGPADDNTVIGSVMPKIRELADAMLFKDEAPMGETGIDGDDAFQRDFTAGFPKTKEGDSLGDFHLGNRIFRNRCSYMIHSQAFTGLPEPVKSAVLREIRTRLTQGNDCGWIEESERKRILNILGETVPGFR